MEERESFLKEYAFEVIKIAIASILIVLALALDLTLWVKISVCAAAAIIAGFNLILELPDAIREKEFFGENTLMLIASVVAFVIGEYVEGGIILILFSLGELLEDVATDNSHKKIAGLAEMRTDKARLVVGKAVVEVSPDEVQVGSVIEVRKGDRVPIDGELLSDFGEFDLKAITGESKFYSVERGEKVFGGGVNKGDVVRIKTTVKYADSTTERIIAMVESSEEKKAKSQKFITSFSKIYTPAIILLAILVAVIPPIFDGYNFTAWIMKALNFMVISCPCALVISVPLAYFVGIGSLAKRGVLVKGGSYLETLSKAKIFAFDKTGTLTEGKFFVADFKTQNETEKVEVLSAAYSLENASSHPVAKAIFEFCAKHGACGLEFESISEKSGVGVYGRINGDEYIIGGEKLLKIENIFIEGKKSSAIYLVKNKNIVAEFYVEDRVKEDAASTVSALKKCGATDFYVLSGDENSAVQIAAKSAGIDKAFGSLMPENKLEITEKLISENKGVVYTGDGINDAPTLKLADVGVAMGGLGSEAAIESADVVIMDDDVKKIAVAKKHAKKVRRIVLENIIGSLAVKIAIMIVSVITAVPVYIAMAGDVGVMLIAVVNSLRGYKVKEFDKIK
ncbi:MAG: heavy metal translocating P-type ATPase [Clostridia bacterium]|nr:heavy metal translocating P-type ATPase [Clostridia bacterium]